MEKKTSAARLACNARYDKTQDRIALRLGKEDGAAVRAAAAAAGQSVNAYIVQAIRERMERDGRTDQWRTPMR